MSLKHYFPLSVAVFALAVGIPVYYHFPVAPFAVILLTGETLLGFQLEDHKIPKALKTIFTVKH